MPFVKKGGQTQEIPAAPVRSSIVSVQFVHPVTTFEGGKFSQLSTTMSGYALEEVSGGVSVTHEHAIYGGDIFVPWANVACVRRK